MDLSSLLKRYGVKDINGRNNNGMTPLCLSVRERDYGILVYLINEGADLNASSKIEDKFLNGYSFVNPLQDACAICDYEMVKILVESGANVNLNVDRYGYTALHTICSSNKLSASLMMTGKKDIKTDNEFRKTVLKIAEFLIDNGADINARTEIGSLPIHIASLLSYGNDELIRLLIMKGSRLTVGVKDNYGNTPLHYAARSGWTEIINELLLSGSDINSLNENAENPLHVAVKDGQRKAIKLLIEKGAKINIVDIKGNSSLHSSVKIKRINSDIVELLLQGGANLCLEDSEGKIPIFYARGNRQVYQLFKKYGSKGIGLFGLW